MLAVDLLEKYDHCEAFHYIDPTYVASARSRSCATSAYKHEMTEQDHIDLSDCIKSLEGKIAVSGYRCDLYDELYEGWRRAETKTHADGASKRIESLWLNYEHLPLFSLAQSIQSTDQQ